MSSEWRLELADWSLRASEFRALREHTRGRSSVAMEYLPTDQAPPGEWERLRELWLELEPYPHVLCGLDVAEGGGLLLRYAALEWHPRVKMLDTSRVARETVARWGVQVAEAFTRIVRAVPRKELWRFLRPSIWVDLEGAARVRRRIARPASRSRVVARAM